VAIVFGAGLTRSGEPTAVLYDRVALAAELYQRGLVKKLLLRGDNRFENYNEPEAMRRTAIKLGIPAEDLVLDYAGRRTYDSCYRAHEIFGVQRAILVTQAFHLERALYLCEAFGIDGVGVKADRRNYAGGAQTTWLVREAIATLGAWIDVNLTRPTPVLGPPLPIEN
jgi:SanA protein